jgi:hypothetical protein
MAASGSAQAQEIPALTLIPGEAVTVRFDDSDRAGPPEPGRAAWSRFDIVAARQLTGMTPPDAPMAQGLPISDLDGMRPEPIPANEVRVRLLSIADRHALLVVENGRNRALAYRARMTVNGQVRHTDVCVVLPRLPSYEHWPHRVERIELSDFRFVPWVPGRAPTCQ